MQENKTLPEPSEQERLISCELSERICQAIVKEGGFLPFSQFMNFALYDLEYGYYRNTREKIGQYGDFVTSPSITSLFGQTLAKQFQQLLPQTDGVIYEFGAGNGELARDLLSSLSDEVLKQYIIIEVSPVLMQKQRETIAQHDASLLSRLSHIHSLPEKIDGIVLGNEVLDAMPCDLIKWFDNHIQEVGVVLLDNGFSWGLRSACDDLREEALRCPVSVEPYCSELHRQQKAFIRTISEKIVRGAIVMIDYGFDAHEYYHPQRVDGTLIGHYRHHTIHNPFFLPGLVDLTCHVNFTSVADAAIESGLDFIGYTTQAYFLVNSGITECLQQIAPSDTEYYIREAAACQKLLNPHEMGELFKVFAAGKNIETDWQGFQLGDLSYKL